MQLKGERTGDEYEMNYIMCYEEGSMRSSQNSLPFGVFWIRTKGWDYKIKKSAVLGHGYLSLATSMWKSLSCKRESHHPSPHY